MAITGVRTRRQYVNHTVIDNFSVGMNTRDGVAQVVPGEATDPTRNWTLDDRGAITWRKGCGNKMALPGDSGQPAWIFFSSVVSNPILCVRRVTGTPNRLKLFTTNAFGGSWTDRGVVGEVPDTNQLIGAVTPFVDWPSPTNPRAVFSANNDAGGGIGGIWDWSGSALTHTNIDLHLRSMSLWNNRLWGLGGGFGIDRATLYYSDVNNYTGWSTTTNFTRIREKDGEPLYAMGVAGGALILFKKQSTYRVTDSASGAYQVLDSTHGCIHPRAIIPANGRLYVWGQEGLYECDGVSPLRLVGDKMRPLFANDQMTVDNYMASGWQKNGKIYWAFPSSALLPAKNILEFDPRTGAMMQHSWGNTGADEISDFAQYRVSGSDFGLYGAVQDGNFIREMYTGVAGLHQDESTTIPVDYWTGWIAPYGGKRCRVLRIRVRGRIHHNDSISLFLRVYKDYDFSTFDEYDIGPSLKAGDVADDLEVAELTSIGQAVAFRFEITSGSNPLNGDVKIQSIELDSVPLESY